MNEQKFFARNHCLNLLENKDETFYFKIKSWIFKKWGIWDIHDLIPYKWSMFYWDCIKPLFKPCNRRIRNSIPRQWCDISQLIVDVNFEFVKTFYETEFKADIVDWNATEHHKEFAEWLTQSYLYITEQRPKLQKDLENAYPPSKPLDEMFKQTVNNDGETVYQMVDDGVPYNVKYAEVNRIEKLIDDSDTALLQQIIKRRDYFWT